MKLKAKEKQKHEPILLFLFKQIWIWDKGMFLSMFLYTIFFSLSPMIAIYVPKLIIDSLQAEDWNYIPALLVVGFLVSGLAAYMIEFLMGNYRMRFNGIRYKLIERLNLTTMTMAYPLTEDADILDQLETITRTLLNPNAGPGGIMQKLLSVFGSIVGVLGFAAIISSLNIWVLILLFGSIVITYWLSLRSGKYEEKRSDEYHGANRRHYYSTNTASDFRYGKDIRLYQLNGLLIAKRNEAAENVMAITRAIANHKFSNELTIALISLLRDILVYGFITLRFLNDELTAGDFILYTGATSAVVLWLSDTMRDFGFIQVNSKYVRKYQEFLKEARVPNNKGIHINANGTKFKIEFKGVSFKYEGSERLVLDNLNLKLAAGERLALVGENGAGKTTIVKLLTRLYEPTSGEILLNGINIQEYNYLSYQYLISTVLQDAKIFPFTIADNIMLGQEYDRERLWEAIEKSGLKSFIDSLSNGVDTWLLKVLNDNGIDLSGGQRQKLYFARSIYNDCPVVVLDEPTAALDPLAEYEMYQSFNQTLGNKSALFISHRLASTRFCDNIAFLENGRITEFGKHEALVKNGGSYANLFEIQAHYYRKENRLKRGEAN